MNNYNFYFVGHTSQQKIKIENFKNDLIQMAQN